MRLDSFPESESVRRLQKNLCDKNVAASFSVDPLHRFVGVGRGTDPRPSEGLERLSQRLGHSGPTIHEQNFHWDSCLR